MSLNYLATRFTAAGRGARWCCSATAAWSAAARIPTASACSATRAPRRSPAIWTGERASALRQRPQRRRIEVLRRLRAEAAAPKTTSRRRSGRSTSRHYPRGSTSSARRPATSRALRRAARRRPASPARVRPACSTSTCSRGWSTKPGRRSAASTSSTTARRSCTSARSRCASTSSRGSRTSISTPAPTGSHSPRSRSAGWCTRASTRSPSRSTARPPESYVEVPAARRFRQGDPQPARRGRREAQRRPRRAVHQLALHPVHAQRQRRGDAAGPDDGGGDRRRSPVLGADRSSREHVLAPLRARQPRRSPRIRTRSGTTTTSATPSPAPRRARRSRSSGPLPGGCPLIARRRPPVDAPRPRVQNRSTRPFPAQASYGRRLVRLGAQLCGRDGALVNRDYERAWLPATLPPGARCDVPITITAPARAGTLRAEVRSGQRGDRLVRGLRLADDDRRRWW